MRMLDRIMPPFPRLRAIRTSSAGALAWAALATALAGCEGSGSVVHSARLDAKPDMLCMKEAVAKVPGVSHVSYIHVSGADKREFDEISYEAGDQHVMLMVEPDREYKQTFLRLGGLGADTITPRVRRVMGRVDLAVEKDCHIRNLSRKVRETCGNASQAGGK